MKTGWSDKIREVADSEYVKPARLNQSRIRIPFGDFQKKMEKLGLPTQHPNQVASSIEARKFWEPRGLQMCGVRGQSRKADTVFEFKFIGEIEKSSEESVETPQQRAFRLTEKLRGLMKDEIAAHGGTEGFMRWVRSEEESNEEQSAA